MFPETLVQCDVMGAYPVYSIFQENFETATMLVSQSIPEAVEPFCNV